MILLLGYSVQAILALGQQIFTEFYMAEQAIKLTISAVQ